MDGTALAQRPNLREALRTLPPVEVARTFKSYNSRFNLGKLSRNFNEPTLSLLLLDDRYRPNVRFTRKGVQRRPDGVWVTIGFTELQGPNTLIRDLSQNPAASKGEFVVESGSGRVRRAHMVTFAEHYQSGETMSFAPDPRIKLATTFEKIRGSAKYTNYRRFEVKVIIR
jgi:hypothetical protein